MRYRVTTSAFVEEEDEATGEKVRRKTFAGKIYGVQFQDGVALFDDLTVNKRLGLTAEQIAMHMQMDFGLHVEKLDDTGKPLPPEEKKAAAPKKPKTE